MELTLGNGSYLDCFRANERKNRARTLTGMALQGCQQLTGINFICEGTTMPSLVPPLMLFLLQSLLRHDVRCIRRYNEPIHGKFSGLSA
jgi:hypothetical protein